MVPLVNLLLLNNAFAIIVVGGLLNFFEPHLPSIIVHSFRYGKFAHKGPSVAKAIEIPKSHFRHFYAVAIILYSISFIHVFRIYYLTFYVSPWIISLLDFFCGSDRNVSCSPGATLTVLLLLTIQCYRRFYETFFIQVFAANSKINFFQYIVGHTHYIFCLVAILGHSSGFTNIQENIEVVPFFDTTALLVVIPSIILFTVAWLYQLQSNLILANLRKDKNSSKIVSEKYFIPKGGWFEYISCPHQLCEILIYFALGLLLGNNSSWFCVIIWVLSNQIETSLLSHWWYKEKFPNYPNTRKALVPYIL